ncbi:prolipoprotein diacylglyceryl transferase [Rhodococcus aetherivorans]|uniref:prolipoprotein diacylglyceryl transferase n=1 Tax=Rhodococcus aetherivorans TaxID=191292 RepID=UPI00388F35A4
MTSTAVPAAATVLAYLPSPPQGVWYLGPIALRAYALCIIVGIVVAIFWGDRRWIARGGEPGTVLDIAVWAVPFGLIGGRLYHVATDWQKYFGEGADPLDALKIWQGGLGIWGAVALGGVGAWIGCRRRGVPLPALGDAVAPAILLAQAIGRLGNWFNQELYGRETTVPWGLEIYERRNDAGQTSPDLIDGISTGQVAAVVHPTFLYELLWNLLVVLLLVFVDRRFRIGHGRLFALYVAGYSAGRFFVELMRSDPATEIAGIRINSFTSAIVFVLAVAYVVFARKGREAPEELKSRHPHGATAAAADATATGDGIGDGGAADDEKRDGASGPVASAEAGGKVETGRRSENGGDKS